MPNFVVIDRATGQEVSSYSADAPVEWIGLEFATHEHRALPAEPEPPAAPIVPEQWFINVGPFYDRFGPYKLPILASTDPLVQAIIKDTTVRKYIDLKGRRAELAQAIGLLQSKGFAVSEAAILDVQPADGEVYRG